MTTDQTTDKVDETTHNARMILQQALDTIVATYWITGAEFKWAHEDADGADITKFKEVTVNPDTYTVNGEYKPEDTILKNMEHDEATGTYTGKVTGVCSIGAIALATSMLYMEPLATFDTMANNDPETMRAALALSMAIKSEFAWTVQDGEQPIGTITGFNDDSFNTREDIVLAFEKAVDHPLAKPGEIWEIYREDYDESAHLYYSTEREAREAIEQARTRLKEVAASENAEADAFEVDLFEIDYMDDDSRRQMPFLDALAHKLDPNDKRYNPISDDPDKGMTDAQWDSEWTLWGVRLVTLESILSD